MQITVGGVTLDVVLKDIKNVHLSVHPPTGRVTIAAPAHMSLDTVRLFAIAKVGWIRQQQDKLNQQDRETPREFLSRESHYVWGERYLMKVIEVDAPPAIELKHNRMVFQIRPGTDTAKKKELLDGLVQRPVARGCGAVICGLGAEDRGEGQRIRCAPHEDQMGQLQPDRQDHSAEHRPSQKAKGVFGIHCRP